MPSVKLTDAAVTHYKPPRAGQVDYYDKTRPGLALRISHKGRRTWTYHFRFEGKQYRRSLGVYPAMKLADARIEWARLSDMLAAGDNPAQETEKRDDTFAVVAEDWLKRDQAGNKTIYDVRRAIEKDVIPFWGERQIGDISRRDALELIDRIADRGAETMARRVHSYLHRLFRWAVGRGIVETSPVSDLPKPGREVSRDRVLSDDELVAVWKAAGDLGWPFGHAVKLLVLTGARRAEITELRWSEIHDDTIHLEGERTKGGKPHAVPLSPAAKAVLADLPRMAGCPFVFSTTGTTPVSGWSRAKQQLDRLVGIEPWRIHDLRRSVATGLQRLGVDLQTIEAVLAHTSGSRAGIVAVYQRHSFDDEKRVALARWGAHIDGLLSGTPANVTPLRVEA